MAYKGMPKSLNPKSKPSVEAPTLLVMASRVSLACEGGGEVLERNGPFSHPPDGSDKGAFDIRVGSCGKLYSEYV